MKSHGFRYIALILIVLIGAIVILAAYDGSLKRYFRQSETMTVSPLARQLGFSNEHPLIMGMNTNYAPLQYVDPRGLASGYDVEFTKVLMSRLGIPFSFSPNHWDKMSPGILSGKYDLGLMVYSSYRQNLTNYSDAVFRLYYQIVYRKSEYEEFDFRHLKGKKIAYMKSRPVGILLRDGGAKDYPITALDSAVVALSKGQYDGVICYRFQAAYYIEKNGLNRMLKADELSLEPREYCYASAHRQLIDAINDELKKMEEEGVIDDIYGREVLSQFDAIEIPAWVWALLVFMTFVFLLVFSINRYLLSKRLLVANARAEESTRMKSNFIKQISHEIRTPLNILSGFTQVLTSPQSDLSAEEKEHVSKEIMASTARITGLVNKMLELSDVSSQAVIECKDEVPVRQIAEQAVKNATIADVQHLEFHLILGSGSDAMLKTNLRTAVRILELLLDNAVKFTKHSDSHHTTAGKNDKEQVRLIVESAKGHAHFIVEDTGIGIPPKDVDRIFDEFVQLDEYYDGTGIGLTVARSLARRLKGDVVLDTSYTGGARFVMTL